MSNVIESLELIQQISVIKRHECEEFLQALRE